MVLEVVVIGLMVWMFKELLELDVMIKVRVGLVGNVLIDMVVECVILVNMMKLRVL